jgi:uncharacterized protein YndB with AHSA1/START domain
VRIFLGILAVAIALVTLTLVIASFKPDDFHVERTARIDASPSTVYGHLNDFREWPAWSPWAKLDPRMQSTFDGPTSGVGAGYRWSGNGKVGEGSMRILESAPPTKLVIQLEFLRPFRASNRATFTLRDLGDRTAITWAMDGKSALISKAFGLFVKMDRLVGADFDRGLRSLKALSETHARPPGKTALHGD